MDNLHALLTGPGHLRFIIQPLVALLLGLRDARLDVAAGAPPFVFSLVRQTDRGVLARAALRQIAVPLAVAVVLDAVLQYVILDRIRWGSALVTGAFLIALPYALARGLGNRALRRIRERHA